MFLVTGATGNVGRHVVRQLLAAGESVRALTRSPEKARLPAGAEVVGGDLTRPETAEPALEGVSALFLFPSPGTGGPILRAARERGVRRVVMLSSSSVEYTTDGADNAIVAYHKEIEHEVETSGLEWTLVRPCGFAVNTLQWAPQIRAGGVVRGPYAEAEMALIDERDIADVATRMLRTDGHVGAKYVLTGPEPLTQTEQARRIGEAIGRPVRYEEVPPAVAREQMIRNRVPADLADMTLRFQAGRAGVPAEISPTVEEVTGRPARTFDQWAADHAADFR
ncbi:SDR family oxidoreductase [Streptomyces sp. NBC_00576]|uniref:SDR family oxidoreductase n=1 Tax=Streptomyces sp. NBC_00576 TaxID=2903665 RepID=UPI002E822F7B|nr:SDR family oxidoreductase [Streptomyces sp. NBC_00576]WUB73459.1 SDR family oxidoreductase [Streptomyces sp. NBC_00576]